MDMQTQTISPLVAREFAIDPTSFAGKLVQLCPKNASASYGYRHAASLLDELMHDKKTGLPSSFAGVSDRNTLSLIQLIDPEELTADTQYQVAQAQPYYKEVHESPFMREALLRQREEFARQTGFLLMGSDECLAVAKRTEGVRESRFRVFENNELGVPRQIHVPKGTSLAKVTRVKKLANLSEEEVLKALNLAHQDIMGWGKLAQECSDVQRERFTKTLHLLKTKSGKEQTTDLFKGASCRIFFVSDTNRDSVEDLHPINEGWERQYTPMDCWNFGFWINRKKMETMSFFRSEITHLVCATQEGFESSLKEQMVRFGCEKTKD